MKAETATYWIWLINYNNVYISKNRISKFILFLYFHFLLFQPTRRSFLQTFVRLILNSVSLEERKLTAILTQVNVLLFKNNYYNILIMFQMFSLRLKKFRTVEVIKDAIIPSIKPRWFNILTYLENFNGACLRSLGVN